MKYQTAANWRNPTESAFDKRCIVEAYTTASAVPKQQQSACNTRLCPRAATPTGCPSLDHWCLWMLVDAYRECDTSTTHLSVTATTHKASPRPRAAAAALPSSTAACCPGRVFLKMQAFQAPQSGSASPVMVHPQGFLWHDPARCPACIASTVFAKAKM
jgi:hypothetical protein